MEKRFLRDFLSEPNSLIKNGEVETFKGPNLVVVLSLFYLSAGDRDFSPDDAFFGPRDVNSCKIDSSFRHESKAERQTWSNRLLFSTTPSF